MRSNDRVGLTRWEIVARFAIGFTLGVVISIGIESCSSESEAITEVTLIDTTLTHLVLVDVTVQARTKNDSILGSFNMQQLASVSADTALSLIGVLKIRLPKPPPPDTVRLCRYQYWNPERWVWEPCDYQ